MKQGSTDDPFAEDPEPTAESEASDDSDPDSNRANTNNQESTAETTHSEPQATSSTDTQTRVLPYIYKRDSVKESRNQRPVYLRDYNEDRISDLVTTVSAELGEEVAKTDVLEAAMEVAIENPDQVAALLRSERYGYDWE